MDRQTRKDLKTDKFAEDVFDVFDWASAHKTEVVRYGAVLVALVLIVVGVMYYNRSQATAREEALCESAARRRCHHRYEAVQPTNMHFDTEAEKTKAKVQAFTELSAKYSGTQEGAIADMYLASYAVDAGNHGRSREALQTSGRRRAQGLRRPGAHCAVADIHFRRQDGGGRESVARCHCQSVGDGVQGAGSTGVGRDAFQSNPTEAHKLLDPLRTSARGTISRTAIVDSANIAQAASPGPPPAGQVT